MIKGHGPPAEVGDEIRKPHSPQTRVLTTKLTKHLPRLKAATLYWTSLALFFKSFLKSPEKEKLVMTRTTLRLVLKSGNKA
jgi:hypothetical protein